MSPERSSASDGSHRSSSHRPEAPYGRRLSAASVPQRRVDDFAYALDSGPGASGRATVVCGARGSGRTALLEAYHEVAASRGWRSVRCSAAQPFLGQLTREVLPGMLLDLGGDTATAVPEPDVRHWLMKVLDRLAARSSGLLLTLDDASAEAVGEVQELGEAIAFAFSERAPVAIAIAGTVREIDELTRADDSEFLRRADRTEL